MLSSLSYWLWPLAQHRRQTAVKHNYGWKKQRDDPRDELHRLQFAFNVSTMDHVKRIDLRAQCPPVYDQGDLGSCTANACAAAFEYMNMKENAAAGETNWVPSRLFIYYNSRALENTVSEDSGAELRDVVKCIAQQGVCFESAWPYDIAKFTDKPPQTCYDDAIEHHRVLRYHAVSQTLPDLKAALGLCMPIIFGFTVFESFESDAVAKTGVMPMPAANEKMVGGHAVVAVGYDEDRRVFIVRNSWGENWGIGGYFEMPFEFILNNDYCSDFWVLVAVQ